MDAIKKLVSRPIGQETKNSLTNQVCSIVDRVPDHLLPRRSIDNPDPRSRIKYEQSGILKAESSWMENQVSPDGAAGIAQMIPSTAVETAGKILDKKSDIFSVAKQHGGENFSHDLDLLAEYGDKYGRKLLEYTHVFNKEFKRFAKTHKQLNPNAVAYAVYLMFSKSKDPVKRAYADVQKILLNNHSLSVFLSTTYFLDLNTKTKHPVQAYNAGLNGDFRNREPREYANKVETYAKQARLASKADNAQRAQLEIQVASAKTPPPSQTNDQHKPPIRSAPEVPEKHILARYNKLPDQRKDSPILKVSFDIPINKLSSRNLYRAALWLKEKHKDVPKINNMSWEELAENLGKQNKLKNGNIIPKNKEKLKFSC